MPALEGVCDLVAGPPGVIMFRRGGHHKSAAGVEVLAAGVQKGVLRMSPDPPG